MRWNEGNERRLVVVAPLRFGHRSVPGDEVPRRRTVIDGDRALRCDLGLDMVLMRCAISPR
jgi:hypothetical protein